MKADFVRFFHEFSYNGHVNSVFYAIRKGIIFIISFLVVNTQGNIGSKLFSIFNVNWLFSNNMKDSVHQLLLGPIMAAKPKLI